MFPTAPPEEPAGESTRIRSRLGGESQAPGPTSGDVVLRQESAGPRFTVRQVPGTPQYLCSSRERALGFAGAFARRYRVRVWQEENQGTFTEITPNEYGGDA
jgi:hypothetical protein